MSEQESPAPGSWLNLGGASSSGYGTGDVLVREQGSKELGFVWSWKVLSAKEVTSLIREHNSHAALVQTLERLTQAFRPFTSRPIGGEGSSARLEQQEQIDAHSHALKVLAAAKGGGS